MLDIASSHLAVRLLVSSMNMSKVYIHTYILVFIDYCTNYQSNQ